MTFPFPLLSSVAFLAAAVTGWYGLANGSNADISDTPNIQASGNFTIPAAWNGRRVRVMAQTGGATGAGEVQMLKGGSSFMGAGRVAYDDVSGAYDNYACWSAPITVATGDVFTFSGRNTDTNLSWGQVELLKSGMNCALLKRSTTTSIGTSLAAVGWDDEEYDDNGFHDNTTNNSRITIPSTGLYRFSANLHVNASGGETLIELRINGTRANYTCPRHDADSNYISLISPPISLTAGDYVEIYALTTAASTLQADNHSWFAVEELESGLKYAIAGRSSNGSGMSASTNTLQPQNNETADVGGWFTVNNSNFVVPSGVTHARVGCQGQKGASGSGIWVMWLEKNGTGLIPGICSSGAENTGADHPNGFSAILEVASGNQFDFYARTNAGAQSMSTGSSYWIEECPDYS